jgi:hypothetical protein
VKKREGEGRKGSKRRHFKPSLLIRKSECGNVVETEGEREKKKFDMFTTLHESVFEPSNWVRNKKLFSA